MRLKILIGIGLIALVVALFALTRAFRSRDEANFASIKRGDIVEAIYGLGKVKTRRRYEVKIGILANARKIFVDEGDKVKTGDPLIQFSESGLFKAPFEGIVTLVAVDEGETVVPQAPVIRIEDPVDKYIEVSLEQQGALRVREGQSVQIVFESLRGEKLHGRVVAVFAKNDEFLTHIEVEGGLPPNILPGMTADVAVTVGRHANATLIPVAAVNNGQVIVLRDGRKQKVSLSIGAVDGQMAQVLDGDLQDGDRIFVGKAK